MWSGRQSIDQNDPLTTDMAAFAQRMYNGALSAPTGSDKDRRHSDD